MRGKEEGSEGQGRVGGRGERMEERTYEECGHEEGVEDGYEAVDGLQVERTSSTPRHITLSQ